MSDLVQGALMKAQLSDLLRVLQEHQHQLAIAYFSLAALSWRYCLTFRSIFTSSIVVGTMVALGILTILVYISILIYYLLYPNYTDHALPTVASISWLWMHGHDLYPNWTAGDVYILPYGPLIFLLNGMALLLSPSIFCTKLLGILPLGIALAATLILLKRTTGSGLTSFFLLASLVLLFGTLDQFVYQNRAEPFLILASVLGLLIIASGPSSLVAVVSVGVLAGAAAALKLYGFVYLIPVAAAAVARVETLRGRLVMAIIGSLCAAASALLPYLEKGVSIGGFLQHLRVQLGQHWRASLLIQNLLVTLILTVPILVIWIWRKHALNHPDRWLFIAFWLSAVLVVITGAKSGAGSYYLLPLMPIWIYMVAVGCASFVTKAKLGTALILFVSFFLAYGPNLLLNERSRTYLYLATQRERDQIAEMNAYASSYPDAQIGVSDDEHYSSYFYRVLPVWNGRPLHVDFTTWMDAAFVGIDEEYITRFIKGCAVKTWILPLGTPFTMINWYNGRPLVSESFRQTFFTNYRQIKIGEAYQVWQCNLAQSADRG
jgi:hypothetical protein